MGWSLKGILAGAGKGMADWAGREIVAEKQAERDAAQFARQKELATFQDEIAAGREARTLELKDKYVEKKAGEERERMSETLALGNKDAEELGYKPGSKEYNRFMGDFLRQSDFAQLGDKFTKEADTFEDNDLKRKQMETTLTAAAMRRSGGDGDDSRAEERSEKSRNAWFKQIGTYSVITPDPDNPGKQKRVTDTTQIPVLDQIYGRASSNKELRGQAKEFVQAAAVNGQALYKANPSKYADVGHATQVWVDNQMPKAPVK